MAEEKDAERYMRRALELAARARGRTSPNPMVGAVLVSEGTVVGEGFHRRAGAPHAEVEAIAAAGAEASGADLYVNLEPCAHHGRTPPCAEAVARAGIRRVYASLRDPNPRVAGRGADMLRSSGIDVFFGLLEGEAARLNEIYLKHIRTKRPFVILKSAMTLDGKIATRTGDSRWVSGEESRLQVHRMRDYVDAVMVGIGTVLADDPRLTVRIPGGGQGGPLRVVVDPELRTPPEAAMLSRAGGGAVLLAAAEGASPVRAEELMRQGAEIIYLESREGRIDLASLMQRLEARGVTSVLLEGGSGIASSALEAGIVDKVVSFIAPKIVGGREAPTPVGGSGRELMAEALELHGVTYTPCGRDVMVEGYLSGGTA
jgi:diaminohydroxyphosphoribosylaminopyrimidine deaminase/5-amino-6-(5-phosphoribosylamino)uracil reductase